MVDLRLAYSVPGLDLTRSHDRAVAEVYSNMVGGPMGSRLFDELREQRGLCYWINGVVWGYDGAALLSVDCCLQSQDLAEVYERIEEIIGSLGKSGPTDEEAIRARSYTVGSATLDFESPSGPADHAVDLIINYKDHNVDPLEYLRGLQSVTREELAQLAASVQMGPCIGCVGPVTEADF